MRLPSEGLEGQGPVGIGSAPGSLRLVATRPDVFNWTGSPSGAMAHIADVAHHTMEIRPDGN